MKSAIFLKITAGIALISATLYILDGLFQIHL